MDYTRAFLFFGTCMPVLLSAMRAKQLRARVPIAKKVKDIIYFGVNPKDPSEERGPNPMNPPKERVDWYNWLRDETRKNPEVLSHLKKENDYCEEMTSDLKPLQEDLYQDMLGRLKETDDEVPYQYGPYLYYTRTVKGQSYKIHCRKPSSPSGQAMGPEQVVLDENLLAVGHEYTAVSCHEPSPDHKLLAFAVDQSGYETYTLRIKDLTINALLPDIVEDISGDVVWGADGSTLFYMKMDEEHRPDRCYMHVLGTPQSEDVLVLQEDDSRYWMGVSRTASDRFLVVGVESKETSEHYLVDLQGCVGGASHLSSVKRKVCVHPRCQGLRYDVEHHGDYAYMVTNLGGCKNNRLMKCLLSHLPWPPVTVEGADKVKPVMRTDVTYAKAVVNNNNNIPASAPPALSVFTTPLPPFTSSSSSTPSGKSDYSNNESITDSLASYGGLLEAAVASVKDAIATVYPSSSSSASSIAASPSAGSSSSSVAAPVVMSTPESRMWVPVQQYNPRRLVESVLPFQHFFAICGREDGLERVWLATKDDSSDWRPFTRSPQGKSAGDVEPPASVWLGANCVYESTKLRIGYASLVTPKEVLDYEVATAAVTVLKQQEVPNYDASLYESRRIHCTARDGTQVPISLVYRKSLFVTPTTSSSRAKGQSSLVPRDGQTLPCLLYGYGSYGACIDPVFDYKKTALLDRGVIFAIAHIRGGGEMGRAWYEDEGKYLTKLNTFSDFADCAAHLASPDVGITSAKQLAVVGRSAGGLLIGACVNMFPQLFRCAVADVPFVDVINTMSDPTIPLTVTEWEEWGNPNDSRFHEYMAEYSPYDNVKAQDYPALLVTAGLNDPRVAYWEPAKWVAKLREMKTDDRPLLFKTDMSSGHFSASDRYKFLKETAFEYAFILDQIGATSKLPKS